MDDIFSIDAYDYHLPEELIAQQPAERRDESRLMVLSPDGNQLQHLKFTDFPSLLKSGDCIVMNNTRVFPARLHGRRRTGGKVEFFLLHYPQCQDDTWRCRALTRSSKPIRQGECVVIGEGLEIEMVERRGDGSADIVLHVMEDMDAALASYGQTPLPPYIRRDGSDPSDISRYQTVYARQTGSVAAPTAGLHFTPELINGLKTRNIEIAEVTLHVGYGTFAPVRVQDIREHRIHSEYVEIPEETCLKVNSTRQAGGRVIAVGTTSVRSLEWASDGEGRLVPRKGNCDLYIMPGYSFKIVDCMLTNFHLPRSSLLILVSAFAGHDRILHAYGEAVKERYRFYSYGDAMFMCRT